MVTPIAASFHASHEASWLGTAFLLSNITFTPLYGRLCDILGRRAANASAISLFTLGTIGCAFAPSMKWLIAARFVAGAGGGGIATTGSVITSDLFSLKERGLVGAVGTIIWAVGAALGGPVGGVVTDLFGWRAAFTFQIPLLVLALLSGLSNINYAVPSLASGQSVKSKLARIDFLGCGALLVGVGSALVALGLKENELLPWSNQWVVLTTILAAVFLGLFLFIEAKVSLEPVLPFKLIARRTPFFVCLVTISMYHWPIFFLSLTPATAGEAGAHLIPTSIGNVLGGLSAGLVLHKTGRYWLPSAVAGILPALATLTMAFLIPSSPKFLKWGAILPMGYGFGYVLNASFIALMASVDQSQIPAITGVLWLFRTTGQVTGVAITSAILQPTEKQYIKQIREDASVIPTLPKPLQAAAKASYAVALRWTFLFCCAFAAMAWLSMLFVEELSLESRGTAKEVEEEIRGSEVVFPAPDEEAGESAFVLRT
ncbi:vacuolar amino acid permease [Pseudohyphozyma bogoriensis]|nr:vacuolar amino acid permease [Pseudohyphozyma bogoriensis]